MSETGVVKFHCEHIAADIQPFAGFDELNACRRKLLQLRMIGVDANGIGFGNLSVRAGDPPRFFVTGSGSGKKAQLSLDDYAEVTAYDFVRNSLRCTGRVVASSESFTHAAVYASDPQARAVIHCHSRQLWAHLLERAPSTSSDVAYGTPEMALEVRRLFGVASLRQQKIFAMAGHDDGIVAFGRNVADAFAALMRHNEAALVKRGV